MQGMITIGGKPLNCVDLEKHVSVQNQAAELFNLNIGDNIKLANQALTLEEVPKTLTETLKP